MNKSTFEVFMVLGTIWLIVGLIIYKNMSLWPIGAVFFIIGLIGWVIKKKKESDNEKKDN